MSEGDINLERFAHDVCVHTLEKFRIFKTPDDTRKQNKYVRYDFLPCVSRSVVSYAISIRDCFKKVLEAKYKNMSPADKEKMWNFFGALTMTVSGEGDCFEMVYITLALCTEYIQFRNRNDNPVSLNKVVTLWRDFFDENVGRDFDTEGGFIKFNSILRRSDVENMDKFHEAFISEYCLPYGAKECTEEMAKECAKNHGISLCEFVPRINVSCGIRGRFVYLSKERATPSEASQINPTKREETKPEEPNRKKSDSKDSGSSTDASEDTENFQNVGSSESLASLSRNSLLGIPPHEDVLREIDPFFVENIPSPPKPRSASKSPKSEAGVRDAPLSPSESPEGEPVASDVSRPPSESPEGEVASREAPLPPSESPESEVASREAPLPPSESPEGEVTSSDSPLPPSESPVGEVASSDSPLLPSESPEGEVASSDSPLPPSESPEGEVASSDAPLPPSESPEVDVASSENREQLQETVEQILSRLESDMETLKTLLLEHGVITTKSGRRGNRMRNKDTKDNFPPRGPEGLI